LNGSFILLNRKVNHLILMNKIQIDFGKGWEYPSLARLKLAFFHYTVSLPYVADLWRAVNALEL